ncbi:MAG: hypothetical protein M1587_01545 [Thaumarchaeota archaeon]|nr:hypothetical protein [Nitrososphaerota archaeon]
MKLEFTLRQHTPMIHFQHDQAGATIRGTELKAKLDRFIVEHVFHNNFNMCKTFLVGYSEKDSHALQSRFHDASFGALDYKVRINITQRLDEADEESLKKFEKIKSNRDGTPRQKKDRTTRQLQFDEYHAPIYDRQTLPPFFGNMYKQTLRKELRACEKLLVTFYFWNERLMRHIDSHFPLFLQRTNFGTRQSKGFGSFYLHEEDPRYANFPLRSRFHFSVDVSSRSFSTEFDRVRELFRVIDVFYKTLRSGINQKDHDLNDLLYFKSLMFLYAQERGLQWDKKTIRDHFFSGHSRYREIAQRPGRDDRQGTFKWASNQNNFLFRDLLGLSSKQEWGVYQDVINKKGVTVDQSNQPIISRFKSPILFKPIWNPTNRTYEVHIILSEISPAYLQESFIISNERDRSPVDLLLKNYPEFNINDYLEFCFKRAFCHGGVFDEARFDAHVVSPPGNHEAAALAATLKAIFLQLSQQ